jgi:hypothetical protein
MDRLPLAALLALAAAGCSPRAEDTGVCEPDAAEGCQVDVAESDDLDPDTERVSTDTYDERGRVVASDLGSDCTVDDRWAYAYTVDDQGNVVREDVDYGADGSVDSVVTYSYDYAWDDDGNVLPIGCYTIATTSPFDEDVGDFIRICNEYDADGRLIAADEYAGDAETPCCRELYAYDAEGRLSTLHVDYTDGAPPYERTYTYEEGCEGR